METPEQLAALRRLGCELVQGYVFHRPMPAGQVAAYLRGRPAEVPGELSA